VNEEFLNALPDTIRSRLERLLDERPDLEPRLEEVAEPFLEGGEFPTERWTAEMVALEFLDEARQEAPPSIGRDIEELYEQREIESDGSGPLAPVLVGLATGAATVGAASGLKMFADRKLAEQWERHINEGGRFEDYMKSRFGNIIRNVTSRAAWDSIGQTASSMGFDPDQWEVEVAERLGEGVMSNLAGVLGRAAWSGQRQSLNSLPEGERLSDYATEAGRFARERAEEIKRQQQGLVERTGRTIVDRLLDRGAREEEIAKQLREHWHLSPRQFIAVDNYRDGLREQGKNKRQIDRLTRSYARRLQKQRTDMLSRTESHAALNFGRQRMWQRAVDQGKLPADTVAQWITAADEWVCPHCRRLDGETTDLNSSFEDIELGRVRVPPLHPNCRCIIVPYSATGQETS